MTTGGVNQYISSSYRKKLKKKQCESLTGVFFLTIYIILQRFSLHSLRAFAQY